MGRLSCDYFDRNSWSGLYPLQKDPFDKSLLLVKEIKTSSHSKYRITSSSPNNKHWVKDNGEFYPTLELALQAYEFNIIEEFNQRFVTLCACLLFALPFIGILASISGALLFLLILFILSFTSQSFAEKALEFLKRKQSSLVINRVMPDNLESDTKFNFKSFQYNFSRLKDSNFKSSVRKSKVLIEDVCTYISKHPNSNSSEFFKCAINLNELIVLKLESESIVIDSRQNESDSWFLETASSLNTILNALAVNMYQDKIDDIAVKVKVMNINLKSEAEYRKLS